MSVTIGRRRHVGLFGHMVDGTSYVQWSLSSGQLQKKEIVCEQALRTGLSFVFRFTFFRLYKITESSFLEQITKVHAQEFFICTTCMHER